MGLHKRSEKGALADDAEVQSSVDGGRADSVASGLPIQVDDLEERTAFAFQTLRTASALLYEPGANKQDTSAMSPFKGSRSETKTAPTNSRRISVASVLGNREKDTEDPMDKLLNLANQGSPTVLDVNAVIAVGTDAGWVIVFDLDQNVVCTCGMESIVLESGPVTAVKISSDATYIAVGHMRGDVYLYDLQTPNRPVRSAPALPLTSILSGRKEGHLLGTKIVDIDFVGKRHTSIVTSDETGRAFWWSLGKVMGVESNDVVRLLGGLPDQNPPLKTVRHSLSDRRSSSGGTGLNMAKKQSTMFGGRVLPVDTVERPLDHLQLTALLTPSKLVIVGLKPTPRVLYRRTRGLEGGEGARHIGCLAWLASDAFAQKPIPPSDASKSFGPRDAKLAYSWGNNVRILRVTDDDGLQKKQAMQGEQSPPSFEDTLSWKQEDSVRAMGWVDHDVSISL